MLVFASQRKLRICEDKECCLFSSTSQAREAGGRLIRESLAPRTSAPLSPGFLSRGPSAEGAAPPAQHAPPALRLCLQSKGTFRQLVSHGQGLRILRKYKPTPLSTHFPSRD